MASFMSGMAGNVTAFNTVWTYDIYQSLHQAQAVRPALSVDGPHGDRLRHRCSASPRPTWRRAFNNIMDMLQLVFAFVNAPLFATFLLGMFWQRTTGHGAFTGCWRHAGGGPAPRADPAAGRRCRRQGRMARRDLHIYPSEMAQNFWTRDLGLDHLLRGHDRGQPGDPGHKTTTELRGLVYSLTAARHGQRLRWYQRPATLGVVVLALTPCSTSSSR